LVNDIGVDIDLALHFDKHIDRFVAKAYSRIGLLFRSFVTRITCMCLGKRMLLI